MALSTIDTLLQIRKAINTRADRRPDWFDITAGLCYNFEQLRDDDVKMVVQCGQYYHTWSRWSRSRSYPVPAPHGTAADAYEDACFDLKNMYHRGTQYGRARRELLDHLIECASVDINTPPEQY